MSDTRTSDSQSPLPARSAGLAAGIGAWILWSGIILTGSGTIIHSNVLAGAGIAFFGALAAGWPDGGPLPIPGIVPPVIAALLGLWVAVSPFVLEVASDVLFWSTVVSGVLVALLAVGSVYGSMQVSRSQAAGA